jgi:TolB-like protein/class 3 adenylate cyclase
MSGQRVERRLAAILAVDVAGYSRLMGLDEEGTLAALRTVRREVGDPRIAEHRGRIVKTTGDGLLIEFASVVDAVRCAVEVQREMRSRNDALPPERRIVFRMGINVGDIIIEDGDIFGDGVNIAARLESLAEPGGICLSAAAHEQVRDRLDIAFEDRGDHQVKNIARPVHAYVVVLGASSRTTMPAAPILALPDQPSIVVLPFQNLSGDPEQEYFADGMVEEIITVLSRIRWLFVIARNTSFTYKAKAIDIKRVGREVGVRYVLEGSVRKGGNRVRITTQLVEAETGANLWADRFDGAMEDVFDLQDKVATSVAGVIEPAMQAAETRRAMARPTADLTAYDLYLQSLPVVRGWGKQPALDALDLLRRAIARDPNYGPALAMAAWCIAQLFGGGWVENPEASRREAIDLVGRALRAATDDPRVLVHAAGTMSLLGEDIGTPLALVDRALTLNPGYAIAWFWSGFIKLFAGSTDQAIEHFQTSLRLDPRTTLRPFIDTGIGCCYFLQRRFDEAVTLLAESLRQVPTYVTTAWALASCYAHMDRLDDARAILEHLRANGSPVIPPPNILFRDSDQRGFFLAGLRRAAGEPI